MKVSILTKNGIWKGNVWAEPPHTKILGVPPSGFDEEQQEYRLLYML